MSNLKKIFPFIIPYKKYAYLNIFFNVLYALFSTLSFIALIPMLQVLFDKTKENKVKPVFDGILKIKEYGDNYLSYYVTSTKDSHESGYILFIMVAMELMERAQIDREKIDYIELTMDYRVLLEFSEKIIQFRYLKY